jgi:aspartyl-tRNA synthetase
MTFQDRLPCGSLRASDTGGAVALAGWVDALRDHGELLFIHLRDQSGTAKAMGFLVGQAMQASRGKANPKRIREILTGRL